MDEDNKLIEELYAILGEDLFRNEEFIEWLNSLNCEINFLHNMYDYHEQRIIDLEEIIADFEEQTSKEGTDIGNHLEEIDIVNSTENNNIFDSLAEKSQTVKKTTKPIKPLFIAIILVLFFLVIDIASYYYYIPLINKPSCDGINVYKNCYVGNIGYSTYIYHPEEGYTQKKQIGTEKVFTGEYCTLCRDGTYSPSCATGRGACSWHGGVKEKNAKVYIDKPIYESVYIINKYSYYETKLIWWENLLDFIGVPK